MIDLGRFPYRGDIYRVRVQSGVLISFDVELPPGDFAPVNLEQLGAGEAAGLLIALGRTLAATAAIEKGELPERVAARVAAVHRAVLHECAAFREALAPCSVETAHGFHLDNWAAMMGLHREEEESDKHLRARVLWRVSGSRPGAFHVEHPSGACIALEDGDSVRMPDGSLATFREQGPEPLQSPPEGGA